MPPGSIEISVLECLAKSYGINGSLQRLSGENLNYLFNAWEGDRYVVKIVDDDMPPAAVEMQYEALEHAILAGFALQLPKIIQNINGNIDTGINIHINSQNRLVLMRYIDGEQLEMMSDISDVLLKNIGISLAQYNLVMQGFDHPAAHRNHRWNLAEAGQHRDKISLVEDAEKRALLAWAFDAWEQVKSELKSLPWQFIHGDMNRENILVRGDQVTGLVDFGDSCFNPVVCDLAICLAYIMMDRDDPLETAAIVTRAYHETRPLTGAELSILLPLVCGRLGMSIAISNSRRTIDPDNPNWFGSEESAWDLLEALKSHDNYGVSSMHSRSLATTIGPL